MPRTRLAVAVAMSVLVGAVVTPVGEVGVGWVLLVVTVIVAVTVATLRLPGPAPRPGLGRMLACGGCALLAGVSAIRAAGWLAALCLGAAFLLGSYAVVGGRSWRGLALGALALPWGAVRGARWSVSGERSGVPGRARRTVAIAAVSLVLLAVFGTLLATADRVFADVLDAILPELRVGNVVGALLAGGLTLSGVYLLLHRLRADRADGGTEAGGTEAGGTAAARLRLAEWAVPLALLDLLFALFVGVQVSVLFAGHEHVLDPDGPSYAEYARGGFGQLLAVAVLTLAVIALVGAFADRRGRADRRLLRSLLGLLCLLAGVIAASAVKRLVLYGDAYGFTRSRLLAGAVLVWLAVVFALVLVAGIRLRGRRLPRAVCGAAVAVLLGLVQLNPDALIAQTVIGRFERDGHLDGRYLATLSADAIFAIDRLPEPQRSCALWNLSRQLAEPDPWPRRNLARQAARGLLAGPPGPATPGNAPCAAYLPLEKDDGQRGG